MKRLLIVWVAMLIMTMAHGQGIPYFRNFTAGEYKANHVNYDIETDENGNVFVANFEGLLYYDYAEWRLIHTPGITRVTVVKRASDNTIWVGGYNYFGKVVKKANGDLALKRIGNPNLFRGEVMEIYEQDGELLFIVNNGMICKVENNKVTVKKEIDKTSLKIGMLDIVDVDAVGKSDEYLAKDDTTQTVPLDDGLQAIVMKNEGIVIADDKNHPLYTITDANGLCSNLVSYVAYDGRGHLWGATNKGIFVIHVPTAISHFTHNEGLMGTVLSIESFNGKIYAGTDDGLFRQEGYRFVSVPGVSYACNELENNGNGLLAATADGIYRIMSDGKVRQLTTATSMAMLDEGSKIYSGETNGIYLIDANGLNRKKVCNMNNVRKIVKDKDGTIWAQSLYGMVCYKKPDEDNFQVYKGDGKTETMKTVVILDEKAKIVSAEDISPIPYPLVSYVDEHGVSWLTNNEGKKLYRWKNGKRLKDMDKLLYTINNLPIRSIYTRQNEILLGNDNGLIVFNAKTQDPSISNKSNLFIRSIKLGSDSILWGGFGKMPEMLPELSHEENDLNITFSIDIPSFSVSTLYRYRLNNGNWSSWSANTSASFANLSPGKYTFYVQAHDAFNHITEIASIKFKINPPFYYRWYMNLLYLLLAGVFAYYILRLRLQRLEKEKVKLEKLVKERTAEVVRLEKMATAGKLTQGLIDRILNPLNYINNFTKLSQGLVKDVKVNVEDEKGNIDEENYEDTMEVLDMLIVNLQKVGEHGQSTARTLKAMEEMLKDRTGGIVPMNLMDVIRQDKVILNEYYKRQIGQYGIKTSFNDNNDELVINGNADQLSKTIMSMLGNAVYAVVKKAQKLQAAENGEGGKCDYVPEIALNISKHEDIIHISIRDNGIGMEKSILGKIFDPFFTTKTTGEADGIGLYLSREIVQNHGGDIQVKSVKDEYSEFVITLPVKKA